MQLRSCHTDDCTIYFHEYEIPQQVTEYRFVLLRCLLNMIIGYNYIDKISQTNLQNLENYLNLVRYYVDTILNDERTFALGDLTPCTDTLCMVSIESKIFLLFSIMYSCLKSIYSLVDN